LHIQCKKNPPLNEISEGLFTKCLSIVNNYLKQTAFVYKQHE